MNREVLERRLVNCSAYDMNIHSPLTSDNGYKISIQGKNIGDSILLYERLSDYLMKNNIPFKVATINRYSLRGTNKEQSYKAMTIYCPDGFNFDNLCEEVYSMILDYKGWRDIKTPTGYSHYAGGLFICNDRDNNGNYILPNNRNCSIKLNVHYY